MNKDISIRGMLNMADIELLHRQFENLRSDNKLAAVMRKEANSQLQLWVLSIRLDNKTFHRILYSWVIASEHSDGKWYKTDLIKKWLPETRKYEANIRKYSFYSDGQSITNIFLELLKGSTIAQACKNLQLNEPPENVSLLTLEYPKHNTYIVRPPIFLETESISRLYKDYVAPLKSPSNEVSCVSASLFHLDKMNIWSTYDVPNQPLDCADDLARLCLNTLNKETGFQFNNSDCSRLGNIEWIVTSSTDLESAPLDFKVLKNDSLKQIQNDIAFKTIDKGTISVYLKSEITINSNQLLIRCRLKNNNEITLDQIKIVDLEEAREGILFSSSQPISRIQLTVWVKDSAGDRWDIWYEHEVPIMREMRIAMGLIGLQGRVGLSTLKNFKDSKKFNKKIQEYEKVKQVSYDNSIITGYGLDPWKNSKEQIQDYVKRLYSEKSKGVFLQKGWGKEGPSPLQLAKWFKALTDNTENKKITIVDPYFDTVGLELIAHTAATNTSFEVITCTQIESHDDNLITTDKEQVSKDEPIRATRIKNGCEQLKLILSRLGLKIIDIRGDKSWNNSYFHDRYLLIFDSNGDVSEGYHLSNSLQAATQAHPLLITPIPSDILKDVVSYIEFLSTAKPPLINEATALQIYPNNIENTIGSASLKIKKNEDETEKRILKARLFFAELLQMLDLKSATFEESKRILLQHDFIDSNEFHFIVVNRESFAKLLTNFSERLIGKSDEEFLVLWESFSFWLSNIVEAEKYLNTVIEAQEESLINKINCYLNNFSKISIEDINESKELIILQRNNFLAKSYIDSLYDAFLILQGTYDSGLYGHYHITYAARVIVYTKPSLLVNIIEKIDLIKEKRNSKKIVVKAFLFDELCSYLMFDLNSNIIKALLQSTIPSLRGLGSQAEWVYYSEKKDLPSSNGLDFLDLKYNERIYAFAEWIYNLRIEANRLGKESLEIASKRKAIFSMIQNIWPENFSGKGSAIMRLCGPLKGSWSKDIYHDLLLSLVAENKITKDDAILFWFDLLLEKIESRDNKVSFYAPTDVPLTELCSSILFDLSEGAFKIKVEQIKMLIVKCNREVRRPFGKSIDFAKWNKAKKQGLWIKAFLNIACCETTEKRKEILELLSIMDNKLKDITDSTDQVLSEFAT